VPQPLSTQIAFRDVLTGGLIFIITLLVFWFSPVHQVTDSHYSMLLSEALLKHRSFALDNYNIPRLNPNVSTRDYYVMNGDIWQLELARGHIYYYFPPGSSVLSLPYVAVANALGISSANDDGTYNPQNEIRIQTGLAAILTALTAFVFYFTSRLLLPQIPSVIIALAASLGTQLWSIASRGLWSHTWATLLTAGIVWTLLAGETGRRKINPIILATLLAWLYFVRPNGSIVVVAVTIFILLFYRPIFARFVLTGAIWLTAFITYSWLHFGKLLPSYYQASRLRFDLLPVALAGNLFSPSRGLILYVPALLFVGYLLIRYWKQVPNRRLVWLAISISAFHILLVSTFANLWGDWWGGASFGPRYTTELVPWFVLLALLGLKGGSTHETTAATGWRYVEPAVGALLVFVSVFINGRGATSLDTWKWSQPSTDRQLRAQLWDWRHPQFLAGLQSPAPPVEFPLVQPGTEIDLAAPQAGQYLWYGWSGSETGLRWSDGREATIVFGLADMRDLLLEIRMEPFLAGTQIVSQRLNIKLNNQHLQALTLSDGEMKSYTLKLPQTILKHQNVITIEMPDATSPRSLKTGKDERLLGVRVGSVRFSIDE
jgi:hypothetical protein